MPPLILVSGSPRRAELLGEMGLDFEVRPSGVDEREISADHPRTFALRAAFAKARDVADRLDEDCWVLGADTIVTRQMMLFGKPESPADARRMLHKLSGETHQVITAIALARSDHETTHIQSATTDVTFRSLSPEEIDSYIATGEPMDKAGAYGIQGQGGRLVSHIKGDYYNVVGLPCSLLQEVLAQAEMPTGRVPPLPANLPFAVER